MHSENQFKIILDEYLESSVTLPMCVKESFNVLGSDLRLPCSNYSDYQRDLEHHQLLVKSVFHAVIAQKIVIHQ
ncbi:MAG: hypothetical protein HWD61_14155 [Parachlamydiaceae bacterium]|nr:MAG: hypothetical protein HWD61_14155 [Parachlamydiaceae bacterium]